MVEVNKQKKRTEAYTKQEWDYHLSTWSRSGLSLSEYSRQTGVSVSSLRMLWHKPFSAYQI